MLEKLTYEDFEPHLNTTFQVQTSEHQTVDVELIQVTRMANSPTAVLHPVRISGFALLFYGPADPPLPQKMYTVTHPSMGTIEYLFIVPVGRDEHGIRYEAIFN